SKMYFEEGISYHQHKAYEKAMEKYLEVLHVNPEHSGAYEKLGDIKKELFGDPLGAIEFYKKALQYNKETKAGLYLKIGMENFGISQYQDALINFQFAVSINPTLDTAWYYMGEIASISGDLKKALQYYQNGSKNQFFPECIYGESLAYYKSGDYLKSVALL